MIHRYSYRKTTYMDGVKGAMVGDIKHGEYVKYDDIKHLLNLEPKQPDHEKASSKLCGECYSPECGLFPKFCSLSLLNKK